MPTQAGATGQRFFTWPCGPEANAPRTRHRLEHPDESLFPAGRRSSGRPAAGRQRHHPPAAAEALSIQT
ncbi:hypothetical protein G6F40_014116 [Rhizopus arrhizus]|nr:hypothetical protein G6F40_014116 [Rhizopus arrhizus]